MDAQIKAKWVAALRSGEFEQGRGALSSEHSYGAYRLRKANALCCIGVGCLVAFNSANESGTEEASKRLGLTDAQETALVGMNDADKSFLEIADYIEANL
jgi:hypothetical protein